MDILCPVPIISYLLYPDSGGKDDLAAAARTIEGCEVYPAENRNLLVVVVESGSKSEAGELEQRLLALRGCSGVAMVAAFETEEGGK